MRHPEFELVDPGVSFGRPGLSWGQVAAFAADATAPAADLTLCRRITPADGGEGHFVALLHRRGENTGAAAVAAPAKADAVAREATALYADCFADEPQGRFAVYGQQVHLLPPELPELGGLPIVSAGFAVAELCKNRLEPCHAAFMAARAADCRRLVNLTRDDPRVTAFLRGEQIEAPDDLKGWTAVAVEGITLGFGKVSGGTLKNRYPKGLRLLAR